MRLNRLRLTRALRDQRGTTLIELMVVVVVITVGLIAVVSVLDQATKTAVAAQRHQTAIQIGQREIEKLKDISYQSLGHAVAPTGATSGVALGNPSPKNPNYYVSGARFLVKSNYRNLNSAPPPGVSTSGEELVTPSTGGPATGGLVAQPQSFTVGKVSGVVWRFVTWRAENCANCTGRDSKRLTVAVKLNTSSGTPVPNKPIWVTSVYADPEATPPGVPPPGGPSVSAQPFYLYDSPCSSSARAALTGNHETRDTTQVGATCTAAAGPNLMWRSAPPASQPLNNYSTDVGSPGRTRLRGLGLRNFGSECVIGYDGDTAESPTQVATWKPRVHSWATRPFASAFISPDDGSDTALSVYVESATGTANQTGRLCLTLRRMDASGGLSPIRTVASATQTWPSSTNPTLRTFTFHHGAFSIPAGERLVLTVSLIDSTGDINIVYDHPTYPSVLTVETTTPITTG
jgi:type II secretory pathway pseudopilin PulG